MCVCGGGGGGVGWECGGGGGAHRKDIVFYFVLFYFRPYAPYLARTHMHTGDIRGLITRSLYLSSARSLSLARAHTHTYTHTPSQVLRGRRHHSSRVVKHRGPTQHHALGRVLPLCGNGRHQQRAGWGNGAADGSLSTHLRAGAYSHVVLQTAADVRIYAQVIV